MSRFVSAGTDQEPPERDQEWLEAQQELDAQRSRKAAEAQQQDGKSLYDILQANKAAKQDAFEESIRLKNQFRSLDNDEVDFLDSVMESTRAKEDAVRKETAEHLDLFRRQQEEAERAARAEEEGDEETLVVAVWQPATRRKRKAPEKEALKGVKIRRVSSAASEEASGKQMLQKADLPSRQTGKVVAPPNAVAVKNTNIPATNSAPSKPVHEAQPLPTASPPTSPALGLGLGAYSSEDES